MSGAELRPVFCFEINPRDNKKNTATAMTVASEIEGPFWLSLAIIGVGGGVGGLK